MVYILLLFAVLLEFPHEFTSDFLANYFFDSLRTAAGRAPAAAAAGGSLGLQAEAAESPETLGRPRGDGALGKSLLIGFW